MSGEWPRADEGTEPDFGDVKRQGIPKALSPDKIKDRFRPHQGVTQTEQLRQAQVHQELTARFCEFAVELNTMLPDGPAKDQMLAHLETSSMYANKAYASQYPRSY